MFQPSRLFSSSRGRPYVPKTGDPTMIVTLGCRDGVSQLPKLGMIKASWFNRIAKAGHMLVPKYRRLFGLPKAKTKKQPTHPSEQPSI